MFGFPPLPPFEGMHPLVVHFPIGILLIAWVPMVLGLIDKKRRSGWLLSGLMLLVLGTLFTFGAVLTGEATEDVVEHSSQLVEDAIHEHEEAGEMARNIFIGVTVIYLIGLIVIAKVAAPKKKVAGLMVGLVVAITYIFGALAMANTGHLGGVLVHELGIHAPIGTAPPQSQSNPALPGERDLDGDGIEDEDD